MPTVSYYATGLDHRQVLEIILGDKRCRVFERYSLHGTEVCEFTNLCEIEARYEIRDWSTLEDPLGFALYAEGSAGNIQFERNDFRETARSQPGFRYITAGWGLIQLILFSPRKMNLTDSWVNHNSEKRAHRWHSTYEEMGDPDDWNWKAVNSYSGRLCRQIRKLAVAKMGPYLFLAGARDYYANGGKLQTNFTAEVEDLK